MLQISSEDGGVEARRDRVEEGRGLLGSDGVQGVESETNETVGAGVGGKARRDCLGCLHLLGDRNAANADDVGVDDTAGAAAIAVGDGPLGTGHLLGGARLAGVVDSLSLDLRRRGQAAEDPQVRGAGVKVEVESLGRGPDRHGAVVGIVGRVYGGGNHAARLATAEGTAGHVGDLGGKLVGDGDTELQVGLVYRDSAVELVVRLANLLDGDLAGLGLGGADLGGDRRGDSRADEDRQEGVGKSHDEDLSWGWHWRRRLGCWGVRQLAMKLNPGIVVVIYRQGSLSYLMIWRPGSGQLGTCDRPLAEHRQPPTRVHAKWGSLD